MEVNIIGAGLAGSEAAWYLAQKGVTVNLYEMKPQKFTPAHSSADFAELVCSNSLKNNQLSNASGLLKEELRLFDSVIMKAADSNSVPAGNALAVNREGFSACVTQNIKAQKNINIKIGEVTNIDTSVPCIIATGPLTSEGLINNLTKLVGKNYLYFFDASAPIVSAASVDSEHSFFMSRYEKGTPDYLNCPLSKDEYTLFYNELIAAKRVELKDFEDEKVFEGCMPVEVLARRGFKALLFGTMKPVGLVDPKTNKRPFAALQLRKENSEGTMYNMVGFQTNLTYGEQARVFSLIPALHNAEFVKYGVMHKNMFINAPAVLNKYYQLKDFKNIFIAGQLSGVEGYIESTASGLCAAINMFRYLNGLPLVDFPKTTCMGGLIHYITEADEKNFQPMNSNWGIIEDIHSDEKDKIKNKEIRSAYALEQLKKIKEQYSL